MKRFMTRLRGAVGMGVTWGGAWAVFGVCIGATSRIFPGAIWDRFFEVFDAPLPALAIPGFVGGAIFSIVLGIAGRRRRFDQLSLPRFAAWGALGGALLGLVPDTLVAVGLATLADPNDAARPLATIIAIPLSLLGAASAAGTLWLARRARGGADGARVDVDDGAPSASSAHDRPMLSQPFEGFHEHDRRAAVHEEALDDASRSRGNAGRGVAG